MNINLRAHPAIILRYLKRYASLLLIPLLRALLDYGSGAAVILAANELVLAAAILAVAVVKWRFARLDISGKNTPCILRFARGLALREETTISLAKPYTVQVEYSPIAWAMGGVWLRIYSDSRPPGAGTKKADIEIPLRRSALAELLEHLNLPPLAPAPTGPASNTNAPAAKPLSGKNRLYTGRRHSSIPASRIIHKSRGRDTLLTALFTSSGLTGLLLTVPALGTAGKYLNSDFYGRFLDTAAALSERLTPIIGGAAALISGLFALGFLLSIFLHTVRLARLKVYCQGDVFTISSGLISRLYTIIPTAGIGSICSWRLPLSLNGRALTRASATGFSGSNSILLPAERPKKNALHTAAAAERVSRPPYHAPHNVPPVLPRPNTHYSYAHAVSRSVVSRSAVSRPAAHSAKHSLLTGALWLIGGMALSSCILFLSPPALTGPALCISAAVLMLCLPEFMAHIRLYRHSGAELNQQYCVLSGKRGRKLFTIYFPLHNMPVCTLRSSPSGQKRGVCTLQMRSGAPGRPRFSVHNLQKKPLFDKIMPVFDLNNEISRCFFHNI